MVTGPVQFVTDFADEAVMLPVFAVIAATLLLLRRFRIAFAWIGVFACMLGIMLGLKLLGYALGDLSPALARLGVVTPSGHVAAAATAYGGMLGLLAGGRRLAVLRSLLAALGVAGLIGVTRVLLGEHTVGEAIVGGTVGVAGAGLFAALADERIGRGQRAALAGVTVAVALLFHGAHFSPETTIRSASDAAVRDWLAPWLAGRKPW